MVAIVNKYAKKCCVCGNLVMIGEGRAVKEGRSWSTYCEEHAPAEAKTAPRRNTERTISADGIVRTPKEPENLPLFRAFPGARWDREAYCWRVSVSDADLPRTLEISRKLGLKIDDALLAREIMTEQAQSVDNRLFPFQVKGVDHLSRRAKALLGDEMGLGKTVQTLASLGNNWRVMVICPSALKHNWKREAAKWVPQYRSAILAGEGSFRYPEAGEIVIVNYDILPAELVPDKKTYRCAAEIPSGITLIIDEVHCVKNNKAARSQKVRSIAYAAERVWGLTGTPLLTRPLDLWGILSNTGMSREVFGSWDRFLTLYGASKKRFGGYNFCLPSAEVPERLRRVMLRRLRTEVMPELPRKQHQTLVINGIDAKLREALDVIWDEHRATIEKGDLPPFQAFSRIRARLATSRIPAAIELAEQYEEEDTPLVVFSAHRAPVEALGKRKGWATILGDTPPAKRQEIVDDFQAGKLKGLAATIQAGGVGLTLTHASHALFVDLDWTPALNAQAEDRICRIGQNAQSVHITRMVSEHDLDLHVMDLIAQKIQMIDASIEAEFEVTEIPEAAPVTNHEASRAPVAKATENREELTSEEIDALLVGTEPPF